MSESHDFPSEPRAAVQSLLASRIREVANAGIGRHDVLPFWFGEPDQATPDFIREAAKASLDAGDTFYTHNLGMPELRDAIATYSSGLHRPASADQIAVTSSGVSALMLAAQLLLNPGDRLVAVTPLWPNLIEIPKILGAEVVSVALHLDTTSQPVRWELDLDRLLEALTPGTRALLLNSPNNPTGWTINREQQNVLLAHCRKHGIWLLADDVYERLSYDGAPGKATCAPSFLDICDPNERVVSTNSFSKTWLMTGWRLGWMQVPVSLMTGLGKLIEYNTSCAPVFVQRAGLVAIQRSEDIVLPTTERYRAARDYLYERLSSPLLRETGVVAPMPRGAMYLFFKIDGERDSLALCKRMVSEAGLGLAPGSAFGDEGEGALRWCFANSLERLSEGVDRLERFMSARQRA
jgi:aspartate/methionine/tyrosine aminotransferase